MNRRDAKRLVCQSVALLIDPRMGHDNTFLRQDDDGEERPERDTRRMTEALRDLVDELYERGPRT